MTHNLSAKQQRLQDAGSSGSAERAAAGRSLRATWSEIASPFERKWQRFSQARRGSLSHAKKKLAKQKVHIFERSTR